MELADLVLPPQRRAEVVMGDRRHHQESGGGRVQALVQPVGASMSGSCLVRWGTVAVLTDGVAAVSQGAWYEDRSHRSTVNRS